jgi:hypothetical protein
MVIIKTMIIYIYTITFIIEPAPIDRIRRDMKIQFDVDFPIFDKIEVNGGGQSNLYKKLQSYEGLGISTDSKKRVHKYVFYACNYLCIHTYLYMNVLYIYVCLF